YLVHRVEGVPQGVTRRVAEEVPGPGAIHHADEADVIELGGGEGGELAAPQEREQAGAQGVGHRQRLPAELAEDGRERQLAGAGDVEDAADGPGRGEPEGEVDG